jgi:cytoskeleton protein RodZ
MEKKTPQLFADTAEQPAKASAEPHFENLSGFRGKPDGILDPAGEAGWYLELERVERGLSLDDVAAATGIHPVHIEAIEHGDLTRMPERLEALELIAVYAHALGFDPEPLLNHYSAFLPASETGKRHPADPAPLSSAKILQFGRVIPRLPFDVKALRMPQMGGTPGIVASVAGLLMLVGGATWMFSSSDTTKSVEQIAAIEATADPMPTASTGPEVAEVKVTETPLDAAGIANIETPVGPIAAVPDDPDAMGAFIQQVEGEETTASTTPVKPAKEKKSKKKKADEKPVLEEVSAKGKVIGDAGGRLVLTAKAPVWISVDDAQGKSLMTQMLNAGDTYHVPDQKGLVVLTRDGGRVAYSIDGVEKGLLGSPGEIITGNPLDIEELLKRG